MIMHPAFDGLKCAKSHFAPASPSDPCHHKIVGGAFGQCHGHQWQCFSELANDAAPEGDMRQRSYSPRKAALDRLALPVAWMTSPDTPQLHRRIDRIKLT